MGSRSSTTTAPGRATRPQAASFENALPDDLLARMDAYWRAANYLSVGQIYLSDNPLLKKPLSLKHIKPRLLGHWGTTPSQNFVYVHLNRVIKTYDLDRIYISGPGHGGPALVAATSAEDGKPVPGVVQGAIQMGRYAGRTIARELPPACRPPIASRDFSRPQSRRLAGGGGLLECFSRARGFYAREHRLINVIV